MRYRIRYAVAGVLLGLGAPLGSIVARGLWLHRGWWAAWLEQELRNQAYFYVYMAVGCVIGFTLFGYMMGKRGDQLSDERASVQATFQTLDLLAITDGLTGLYNHRYLQERLALELESSGRYKTPLTCLMLDIDNFKSINDKYGHPFGDLVLASIARIIRENVRRIDTAGRYGGEEFLVLMPQALPEMGWSVAERIRGAVQLYPFSSKHKDVKVTLSIGIATYRSSTGEHVFDKATLLKAADAALYRAKQSGKNQTILAPWELQPASQPH
jgi:diguanylate cyclase (GGDEF)-like protein